MTCPAPVTPAFWGDCPLPESLPHTCEVETARMLGEGGEQGAGIVPGSNGTIWEGHGLCTPPDWWHVPIPHRLPGDLGQVLRTIKPLWVQGQKGSWGWGCKPPAMDRAHSCGWVLRSPQGLTEPSPEHLSQAAASNGPNTSLQVVSSWTRHTRPVWASVTQGNQGEDSYLVGCPARKHVMYPAPSLSHVSGVPPTNSVTPPTSRNPLVLAGSSLFQGQAVPG